MRKFHSVLLLLIIPFISQAQEFNTANYKYGVGNFFVGVNAGVDYNINAYKSGWSESDKTQSFAYGNYTFDEEPLRWNAGVDISVMATEKWRPRLELKYVRMAYRMNWDATADHDISNPGSSDRDYLHTLARLRYFNINLFADYLVFGDNSRLKFFVSPGFKWEMNIGASFKSKTADDGTVRKLLESHWENYYPHSAAAVALAGIAKYDVNEFFGITLKPEYTYFLRGFQRANSGAFQRLSFNVGVEIRIK